MQPRNLRRLLRRLLLRLLEPLLTLFATDLETARQLPPLIALALGHGGPLLALDVHVLEPQLVRRQLLAPHVRLVLVVLAQHSPPAPAQMAASLAGVEELLKPEPSLEWGVRHIDAGVLRPEL